MPLKIPPPWNPGYALPGYVKAEGLQTRAFVTKWMPRGSYDDPSPFNPTLDGAYAVPQYIRDEGYGQGAFVTEWAPRGWYAGAKKMAKRIHRNQGAVHVPTVPEPFASYGHRSAAAILVRVNSLPPEHRKRVLTKVLDSIDPKLSSRTQSYTHDYLGRGMNPSSALEAGLSRAMSEGLVAEIVDIGKKGQRPAPKGQLGLGCYGVVQKRGLSGLGAIVTTKSGGWTVTDTQTSSSPPASSSSAPAAPPQMGQCTADGVYIWKGYWARRSSTDTCTGTYTGTTGPAPSGPSGGITGGSTAGSTGVPTVVVQWGKVGPFSFPMTIDGKVQENSRVSWKSKLPADWQKYIVPLLGKRSNPDDKGYKSSDFQLAAFFDNPPAQFYAYFIGPAGNDTKPPSSSPPILKAKHPVSGEDYGVFLAIGSADGQVSSSGVTGTPILYIYWAKVKHDEPWYGTVWNFIKSLVVGAGGALDIAGDILDTVGGIACNLLQSQAASTAGAAAAASQGAPPQAGSQGVAIAASACGTPPPPGGGGTGDSNDWILPVAIGGGVILAAMLLLPKKKRKP